MSKVMNKRLVTIKKDSNLTLSQQVFDLENLIQNSQALELFESSIFVLKRDDQLHVGLCVIGIDGELFSLHQKMDIELTKTRDKKYPYMSLSSYLENIKNNEIVNIDEGFEYFMCSNFQIISD